MKICIILILMASASSVNCKTEYANKRECKTSEILCMCGGNKTFTTIPVQQCPMKNRVTGEKTCVMCNKAFLIKNPCERLKHCETCTVGELRCSSCPPGRVGPLCEQDIDKEITFPYKVKIARGEMAKYIQKSRFTRDAESKTCKLPSEMMKTNEISCIIYPDGMKCTQICAYAFGFPEGKTRTLSCKDDEDIWHPAFEECEPIADCTKIKLIKPGRVYCVSHRIYLKAYCNIRCYDVGPIKSRVVPLSAAEKNALWSQSECNLDNTWSPSLPACAEPDKESNEIPDGAVYF